MRSVAIFTYAMEHRAVRAQWARELVLFGPSRVDEEKLAASVLSVHIGQGGSVAAMVDGFVEPVLWNALCGSRTGGGSVSGPAPHCRELVFDAYSLFYVRADGTELMRQELVRLRPCLHREPARLVLVGANSSERRSTRPVQRPPRRPSDRARRRARRLRAGVDAPKSGSARPGSRRLSRTRHDRR